MRFFLGFGGGVLFVSVRLLGFLYVVWASVLSGLRVLSMLL